MRTCENMMMLVLGMLVVFGLSGCGVSKDDHEKVVSELAQTKSELAQAKAKIAEMEKSVSKAVDQFKGVSNAPEMLQKKLAASEKEAADLRAKVEGLTGENSRLKELMEKMKAQFEDLQKKFGAIQSPSTGVPGKELPTKDMPADILKKKF